MFVVRLCTLGGKKQWLSVVSLIHANANSIAQRQFLCFSFFCVLLHLFFLVEKV